MTTWEILLIAFGLAMDCLAVSTTSGIIVKKRAWIPMLKMAFFFGLFQGVMPIIGWACASTFSHHIERVDHWIAFGILAFLGIRMIKESFKEQECDNRLDPRKLKVILALAVATSIDALAVGASFAFLDMDTLSQILWPALIIGIVSFVVSIVGFFAGCHSRLGEKFRLELLGGIILIIIGGKILIEHLFL